MEGMETGSVSFCTLVKCLIRFLDPDLDLASDPAPDPDPDSDPAPNPDSDPDHDQMLTDLS